MPRLSLGIITLAVVLLMSAPCSAADSSIDGAIETARKSLEQQQYKKAETALKRALNQTTNTNDVGVARASVLLATALRNSGKVAEASQSLERARNVYKTLGHVEPDYVDEFKALAGCYRIVDLAVIGAGANALKNNAATISMAKTDGGARVEISMESPYQNSLNSTKIDGLQLEKSVTFDIQQTSPQDIRVVNIKGFKIHSVEKNMWVNLLSLKTGAAEADGTYDAEITAGKAGITKTVPSKLPQKAYEPVAGIASQLALFSSPAELDMPVVAAPVAGETATAPAAVAPVSTPVAEPPVSNIPMPDPALSEPGYLKQQVKSFTTESTTTPHSSIVILEKKTRAGNLSQISPDLKESVKDANTFGEMKGSSVESSFANPPSVEPRRQREDDDEADDRQKERKNGAANTDRRDTTSPDRTERRNENKSNIKRDRDDDDRDDDDDDDDDRPKGKRD
ncbi:MAG: tetratricopeptide repeat protein [Candidatus Obscuribacterales bacterium]|nr:tetratricopeptide repeat protein [Candidatus Obscuribacterales bacterium]